MGQPEYDDGLDADGYPLIHEPKLRYRHGCEEDAGNFQPVTLFDATMSAIDRVFQVLDIGDNCESPIEAMLGAAVLEFFEFAGKPLKLCKTIDPENAPDELVFVPQYRWHYYRSDWAILNPRRAGALLIEADGRDWHSSPAQKAHDAKKDAAAHNRGFLTMRFTGSEIHRHAEGCAQKIFDVVHGQ